MRQAQTRLQRAGQENQESLCRQQQTYTRDDILEYYCLCLQQVEAQTALLDPDAPSGFHWLPFTKLELRIYDIRHLQHHAGELHDRLGPVASHELDWVAMRHE